jgi:hypothetical protein
MFWSQPRRLECEDELLNYQHMAEVFKAEDSILTSIPDLLDLLTTFTVYLSDLFLDFHYPFCNPGQFWSMLSSQAILFKHDVDLLANT